VSYDLTMFARPAEGVDPVDHIEALTEADDAALADPAVRERNARIAVALQAAAPELQDDGAKDGAVAFFAENGFSVSVYGTQAGLSIPYWDSLDPAVLARQIDAAKDVIAAETGWELFDHQTERWITSAADDEGFAAMFPHGVQATQQILEDLTQQHAAETPDPPAKRGLRRFFGR
jgi:hypothetical protein